MIFHTVILIYLCLRDHFINNNKKVIDKQPQQQSLFSPIASLGFAIRLPVSIKTESERCSLTQYPSGTIRFSLAPGKAHSARANLNQALCHYEAGFSSVQFSKL